MDFRYQILLLNKLLRKYHIICLLRKKTKPKVDSLKHLFPIIIYHYLKLT